MKDWRRFYLWAAGLLAVFGILVIPAAPAFALSGEINLSAIEGAVGTRVGIGGSGFTDGSFYTILFNNSLRTPVNPDNRVDSGVFSNYFIVPDLPAGWYAVKVTTTAGDTSNIKDFRIKVVIDPKITISSASGYVGDRVTVSGSGFTPSSTARIRFDGNIVGNPVNTSGTGALTDTVITVPETAGGSHTFSAKDSSDTLSPTLSYVVSSKIAITPASGGAGDQVTVSGNGFGAGQSLGIYFDSVIVPAAPSVTSDKGVFNNLIFTVPPSTRGNHTVEVRGGNSSATATFTVGQKITIRPTNGPVGTVVSVSGTGFGLNREISVKFSGALVVTTPSPMATTIDGSFSGSFTVSGAAGAYLVEVSDGTLSSSRNFTMVVTGNFEPKEGNVGTTISVNATGFVPNAQATVTFDGVEMTQAKVAANGGFKASFKAPAVKGGDYQVVATDSVNSFSDTFTMESTAPPVPEMLSPKDKARAGRVLTFQWEDVTDPSDITYNFQLATAPDFKKLLYDEKGLTDSEFSIEEADKLETASKKEPYYWRVKAVDGAFNESDWTKPSSFYTGFSFALPTWGIYALVGVGALVIGLLGFWIGRKTAYY
ncbi:MAG: IPT/TIG domain-containing protein [Chloroflexota bacterium]